MAALIPIERPLAVAAEVEADQSVQSKLRCSSCSCTRAAVLRA